MRNCDFYKFYITHLHFAVTPFLQISEETISTLFGFDFTVWQKSTFHFYYVSGKLN